MQFLQQEQKQLPLMQVPEDVVHQINFILNQLSKDKLLEQAKKIGVLLDDDNNLRFFARGLLLNRIFIGQSNEQMIRLYSDFVFAIDRKKLIKTITKETQNYLQQVISIDTSFTKQDKDVIKNMGIWIGLMTIQKEKPVSLRYMNIRDLLIDTFLQENPLKLEKIVSLVCKILNYAKGTKVFHIKNPWIHVLLCILEEIKIKTQLQKNYQRIYIIITSLFSNLEVSSDQLSKCNYLASRSKSKKK